MKYELFYDQSHVCLYYECFLVYNAKSRWNLFRVLILHSNVMCISSELPFMASLFLYVRNNKLTTIEYSSDMEGLHSYLNGCCSYSLGIYTHFQRLENDYRVESYAMSWLYFVKYIRFYSFSQCFKSCLVFERKR